MKHTEPTKEPEGEKITSKFLEIYKKIDKENPSEQDLRNIQRYLSESNGPSISLQRLSQNITTNLIKKTFETSGMRTEPLLRGIDEMREELGYYSSSTIEQLLIDEIILEFFRTHHMQMLLTTLTSKKGVGLITIKRINDLVSSSQNRLHKSIQTFTKLRKSGLKLQINIATEGGKQVNVQK